MKCKKKKKKKDFENFHLYFLYISIITEERLPFSFDNKYDFLDQSLISFKFKFCMIVINC